MKLRQKLATVMAAAMVVTAVPVVTSATTTNSLSMSSVSIAKDSKIGFEVTPNKDENGATTSSTYTVASSPLTLDLEAKAKYELGTNPGQSFFVTIENGEFSKEAYHAKRNGNSVTVDKDGEVVETTRETVNPSCTVAVGANASATITVISKTELRVDVTGTVEKGDVVSVPVFAVAKSGEVALAVDGTDTFVTSGKYVLGTTSSKKLTATASEATKISVDGGKVGKVVVSEATKSALLNSTNAGDKEITITLPSSSDLEFGAISNIRLTGSRGFAQTAFAGVTATNNKITKVDDKTLKIDLTDSNFNATAAGQIIIDGIEVLPEGKTASKGDVTFTVSNNNMEKTKVTVASVVDEDNELTCEKPVELVAGKEAGSVTFKLAENTEESMIQGRKVDLSVENGFIALRKEVAATTRTTGTTYQSALQTVQDLVADGTIELPKEVDVVDAEANAEGQITGITVELARIDRETTDSLEFTMPIQADINTTGEVKLAVEGRALAEAKEVVIANVKAPFEVTTEAVELKVGLNGQVGGKITIAETAPEMFNKGEVVIAMPEYAGISFKKGQDVEVKAENVTVKNVKVTADEIRFEVVRTSDEAGKIEISNIEFNVDRTAPEGAFDVAIAGPAISTNKYIKSGEEALNVADFVTIGTKNTEDISGSNGLKVGTAAFTINSDKYVVNGEEKTMKGGVPYILNGRTMMPVRYVSEAFGIEGDNVLFNNGVVTLFAGNRIIQLTNGSNVAVVNGVSITMEQAVTIKEGRTYIPVGEVGRLLGVNVSWDNATKTATFKN